MTTYTNDIKGALEVKLNSLAGKPPIAWPNKAFDQQVTHFEVSHLFAGTDQNTLGTNGLDLTNGLFQILVKVPRGSDRETFSDSLADHFTRGLTLIKNSVRIRITSVSVGTEYTDENFYVTPVEIRWFVHTDPRG